MSYMHPTAAADVCSMYPTIRKSRQTLLNGWDSEVGKRRGTTAKPLLDASNSEVSLLTMSYFEDS